MADLATLMVRVDATGAIRAVDQFGKSVGQASKETSAFDRTLGTLKRSLAGLVTIGAVTMTIRKFISATSEAQAAQAQLANAIRATGASAGQSVAALNAHASALQKVSTFGDEAINRAQARLLSYTNIVGTAFPRATEVVLDYAAAFNVDLVQASEAVGKALNYPTLGMAALSKQGFILTDAQKALIKELENTGRLAEAQAIIFAELESVTKGAARAQRETLGGALSALKSAWSDLFEVSTESSKGIVRAIEAITEALPKIRTATESAFSGLFKYYDRLVVRSKRVEIAFAQVESGIWKLNKAMTFGLYGEQQAEKAADRIAQLRREIEAIQGPQKTAATGAQAVADAMANKVREAAAAAQASEEMLKALLAQADGLVKLSKLTMLTNAETSTLRTAEQALASALRDGNLTIQQRIDMLERLRDVQETLANQQQPAVITRQLPDLIAGLTTTIGGPSVKEMGQKARQDVARKMLDDDAKAQSERLERARKAWEAEYNQRLAIQDELARNFRENLQRAFGDVLTDFVTKGKLSVANIFGSLKQMGGSMIGQQVSKMLTNILPATMGPLGFLLGGAGLLGLGSLFGRRRGPQTSAADRQAQEQARFAAQEADRRRQEQEMADFIAGRTGGRGGVIQSVGQVLQETSASRMIGELVAIRIATTRTADAVAGSRFGAAPTAVNVTVQGGLGMVGEQVAEAVDRLLGTRVQTLRLSSGQAVTG